MAPASLPPLSSRMICGRQPVRALAQPVSMSADRNSWEVNGSPCDSAFHSAAGTPARDSTTLRRSIAMRSL